MDVVGSGVGSRLVLGCALGCVLCALPVLAQSEGAATHARNHVRHATTSQAAHSSHHTSSKHASSRTEAHTEAKTEAHTRSEHSVHRKATRAESRRAHLPRETVASRKLRTAFIASQQLRPMAQQLIALRSPAAYSGVAAFAAGHSGEAAAAAELALGHAYMLDHRYAEAESAFRKAAADGKALDDYADYLAAQADVQGNRAAAAVPLLDHFTQQYPDSLFAPQVPVLLANAYLASNNPGAAIKLLQPLVQPQSSTDLRLALAKAYQASGDLQRAAALDRGIYLRDPLSPEAVDARTQLLAMNMQPGPADRKMHADALFNAKQYAEAQQEYRELQKDGSALSQGDRNALEIYAAVCDLKLKRLKKADVERLPVTSDDSAALKLYLQSELARSDGDTDEHDAIVAKLEQQYPQSRWLEEALYSGGNMYILKLDYEHAIPMYEALVERFPKSTYAPSAHWRAAWLSYRLRRYPDAARLMEEQIEHYPAGTEIPGALYWRGRLYEDVEHNFGQAIQFYKAVDHAYVNTYYAMLARQRLAVLGTKTTVAPSPVLADVRPVDDPHLTDELPENDPHLIKARLLANAALNEYIRPEIQLSDTSEEWGSLAEAEIYQSFGENARALQAMKRSHIPFFSLPLDDVPRVYWELVFPRPYWSSLMSDAQAQGLDPFLVAALIRQESEFNPDAVSRANAYGLMQLLPVTGKQLSRKLGHRHFSTSELLNPEINLQLGTIDLKNAIAKYNGQVEYALASYNAGDTPVRQWIGRGDYKDIAEWVESIPYSETRDYVQSILRNREMYRALYSGK